MMACEGLAERLAVLKILRQLHKSQARHDFCGECGGLMPCNSLRLFMSEEEIGELQQEE